MGTTWSLSSLKQTEIDRALARMGIEDHDPFHWGALQWFVGFAQRNLGTATEGDWLQLTEEIDALLRLTTHQQLRSPLSRDVLRRLQEEALKVLTGLVDNDEAHIGKFMVTVFIRRGIGKKAADSSQVKRLGPLLAFPAGPFAGLVGPDGLNGLMYHLAGLLMRFPETVQRCPKCHRLFARFRRHAKFCGRVCQSRVAAQEYRDEDRRKKTGKKKLTKKKQKGAPR